jgi:hypothetical protein
MLLSAFEAVILDRSSKGGRMFARSDAFQVPTREQLLRGMYAVLRMAAVRLFDKLLANYAF